MAPTEHKKTLRLSQYCHFKSHSLDSGSADHPHNLYRTISDRQLFGETAGPDPWRSKANPEYLIRTGSMKSKDIKEKYEDKERDCLTVPGSNYASYILQAGCFMWTGRAYYRDSYIVQRREGKREEKKKTTKSEFDEEKFGNNKEKKQKCYEKPLLPEKKSSQTSQIQKDKSCNESPNGHKIKKRGHLLQLKNMESDFSNNIEKISGMRLNETLIDDIQINQYNIKENQSPEKFEENNSFMKDRPKNVDLVENYSNYRAEKNMHALEKVNNNKCDKEAKSDGDDRLDTSVTYENGELFMLEKDEKLCDLNVDVDSESDRYYESDIMYNKYRDAVLYENCGPYIQKETLPRLERIQKDTNKKTPAELLNRMRDKIRDLIEKQFEADYKIVINEMIAKDIATKLSYFGSEREMEKFNLHVEEFDSVNCLILGLAGRMAKAEQNILEQKKSSQENVKLVAEEQKREKLAAQLSEAQGIKDNIDRRSLKVCRSIERYLGGEDLEKFKLFIIEKEKLISDSKELSDKMKLSKKQLIELELGERGRLDC